MPGQSSRALRRGAHAAEPRRRGVRGRRPDGRRCWPVLAGVLALALAATGTVVTPADAQVTVPTVTVGTVIGASGPTVVPVTVAGFGNAPGLLAVLSLPASSGSLEVDPSGLDLTAVPGSHWSGDRSLSFTGSVADVTTALQSRLSWHPPLQGAQPELEVLVREHVPGTVHDPVSGHDYEVVVTWSSWPDAKASAAGSRLLGRAGYLATLTSQRESDLVAPHVAQARRDVWLGASDDWREVNGVAGTSYADQSEAEGHWHWTTGPEAGTQFWSGGADGGALPGQFANWWQGEPNDFGSGEHYAGMYEDGGTWNDWGGGGQSYLVEYGGLPGEVSTARSATATRTVTTLSALQVLQQYAEGSGPAPTAELYAVLGVAGLEAVTVSAVNSVLVRRGAAAVSSAGDVTALVGAYRDVLAAARDEDAAQVSAADLTLLGAPVLPEVAAVLDTALRRLGPAAVDTADELAARAVTVQQVLVQPSSLVLTAVDSKALDVLGEVLQESPSLTVLELETVSGVVARVFTAAGTLTTHDLARLGAPGVTPDNRVAVTGALGTPASLTQLRAAVAEAVLAVQTAARAVLTSYSSGGPAPTAADHANAGVVGVGPGLLAAVNSALAERHPVTAPAGVQAVVDAYTTVLGTAADPGYSPALTVEDLAALGLGVAPADLGQVVAAVAETADDGSQVQPLPVLRLLVGRATGPAQAATAPVVVPFSPLAGSTRADVSAELPGGRLVLRLEGVTGPGTLDVRTAPVSSRSPAHLDVGTAFVLDVRGLDVTSVRVCLPVDVAALPAGLSVGEVRVLQVVDGRRVDVTSRAGGDQRGVCGSSRTVGEFVLGVETVTRRSGPDRYATAAAASAARFAPGVPVVYLASGRSHSDALAGGTGAAALSGPLLLVGGSGPSSAVIEELERLRPARIALLGGPGALPAGLERSLEPFTDGRVTRLAGADRYSTAAAASRDAFPRGASTAYLASGQGFADAIAGGAAAAADGAPLLLTAGSALPESTLAELARLGADRVVLLGGTDVLSAELLAQLRGRGLEVERRAGSDRYGTAAAAAVSAFPRGAEVVYLASGTTFADALASIPLSADSRAPVLLVAGDVVPAPTATALRRLAPRRVVVVGGSSAVRPGVLAEVQRLIVR